MANNNFQGNSTDNVWMNDPNERDPFKKYATPPDPKLVRAQRASTFGAAVSGLPFEAREQMRAILGALSNMEDTSSAFIVGGIRGAAGFTQPNNQANGQYLQRKTATPDQLAYAQSALNAQRQIVAKSTSDANDAFASLKPAVLGAVIGKPDGVSESAIADRKADLVAAIESAGKVAGNALAQRLIRQAVAEGDQSTIYVLCSDPLKFRAESLGLNQQTLQAVYAQAQSAKVGPMPLLGAGKVPGAALIALFPDIQALIKETGSAALAALDALAKECRLS